MSGQDRTAAQDRAEGVIAALDREASRESEPWLTPASIRVLAKNYQRMREALWQIAEATPSSEDAVTLARAFVLVRGYAREALDDTD